MTRTIPATSLAFSEKARSQGSGKAAWMAPAAASRVARSVTKRGVPNRLAAARRTAAGALR